MKLIQQAYEEKYQSLIEEVNTWKWISEEQSAQVRLTCRTSKYELFDPYKRSSSP